MIIAWHETHAQYILRKQVKFIDLLKFHLKITDLGHIGIRKESRDMSTCVCPQVNVTPFICVQMFSNLKNKHERSLNHVYWDLNNQGSSSS